MNYENARKARIQNKLFNLPAHGDTSHSPKVHEGHGRIITLGQIEAELLCTTCGTHFLALLAKIETPSEITTYPGFHIVS